MRLRQRRYWFSPDEKDAAKLEWVAGRSGRSANALVKAAVEAYLATCEDPPPGFGVSRAQDDGD